jgi:hypothetical protein
MTLSLPEPIANYFAAEMARDSSALARCFTEDGIVRDEGRTFTTLQHVFRIAGKRIASLEIR